jgi:hypothetical protein
MRHGPEPRSGRTPDRGGTIVYVHGASDRSAGVSEHVSRIRASLAARGSGCRVVSADWGDAVGPRLDDVLEAVPGVEKDTKDVVPATRIGGSSRLLQGLAAVIIALQYVNVRVPGPLRVWATDVLLQRRAGLMLEILGLADVLVYQRAGDAIRDAVRERLATVSDEERPLIALGNSLGGIILVDLLREPGGPRPDLLVTVGSQSGVLQSLGALGTATTPPFQPWLNLYDERDFLAFLAAPLWPDEPGIEDQRVDLRLGFPEVHGPAYLADQVVFDAIFSHPALARR